MKPLPNDIVLRPRFQLELSDTKEELLKKMKRKRLHIKEKIEGIN